MSYRIYFVKAIKKVLLHAFAWLLVFLFFNYCFENMDSFQLRVASFSSFLMPVTIGTTYTVIYYLIPNYLLKKKYALFSLYSVFTLILSTYAIVLSIFYALIFLSAQQGQEVPLNRSLIFTLTSVYLVVLLASTLSLLQHYFISNTRNKDLENKVLEAKLQLKEQELKYLKMQIHPHFLFNTLNTLYGHALKQSEEAPEMILKLSNLLDYLLYQADKPVVGLKEEIEHLKDYIGLEQSRYRDKLEVNWDIKLKEKEIAVAPMIFLPFIENSFKHGEINNGKLKIAITLKADEKDLDFSIENTTTDGQAVSSKKAGGIGLTNSRKRLEHLYPQSHLLTIEHKANIFKVSLHFDHTKLRSS